MLGEDLKTANSTQTENADIELQSPCAVRELLGVKNVRYHVDEKTAEAKVISYSNREAEVEILNSFKVDERNKHYKELMEKPKGYESSSLRSIEIASENDDINPSSLISENTNDVISQGQGLIQDVNDEACSVTSKLIGAIGAVYKTYRINRNDSNSYRKGNAYRSNDEIRYSVDSDIWDPYMEREEVQNYWVSNKVSNSFSRMSDISNPYVRNGKIFENGETVDPSLHYSKKYIHYLKTKNYYNRYLTRSVAFNHYLNGLTLNPSMEINGSRGSYKLADEASSSNRSVNMISSPQRTVNELLNLYEMDNLSSKLQSSNADVYSLKCNPGSTMDDDDVQLSSQEVSTNSNPDFEDDLNSYDAEADVNFYYADVYSSNDGDTVSKFQDCSQNTCSAVTNSYDSDFDVNLYYADAYSTNDDDTNSKSQDDSQSPCSAVTNLNEDSAYSKNMAEVWSDINQVDSNFTSYDLQRYSTVSVNKSYVDLISYDTEAHSLQVTLKSEGNASVLHKVNSNSSSCDDDQENISLVFSNESDSHSNLHDIDDHLLNTDIALNMHHLQRYGSQASSLNNNTDSDFLTVEENTDAEKVNSSSNFFEIASKERKGSPYSGSCEGSNANREKYFDSNSPVSDYSLTNRHDDDDPNLYEDYDAVINFHKYFSSGSLNDYESDLISESTASGDSLNINSESRAITDLSLNNIVNSDLKNKANNTNSISSKNSNLNNKINASILLTSCSDLTDTKCRFALNSSENTREIHFVKVESSESYKSNELLNSCENITENPFGKVDTNSRSKTSNEPLKLCENVSETLLGKVDTNLRSYVSSEPLKSNVEINAALVNIGEVSDSLIKISAGPKSSIKVIKVSDSEIIIKSASNSSVTLDETQNTYAEIFAIPHSQVNVGKSSNSCIKIGVPTDADKVSKLTSPEDSFSNSNKKFYENTLKENVHENSQPKEQACAEIFAVPHSRVNVGKSSNSYIERGVATETDKVSKLTSPEDSFSNSNKKSYENTLKENVHKISHPKEQASSVSNLSKKIEHL